VQVAVEWPDGADADRKAIQSEIELKMRQSGMRVLTKEENDKNLVVGHPVFLVIISGTSPATLVSCLLLETVQPERALIAYQTWLKNRTGHSTPITEAEFDEHAGFMAATTWQRYGAAQAVPPESVQDIVARYKPAIFQATPAGRQILEHMMDLEVEAAMANAQRSASLNTVRDRIEGYVDQFLNEWLAANPKPK